MQVQGTTNTGTEVQVAQVRSDQELSDALIAAFQAADNDAKRAIFSMSKLATAIMDVHEAELWKRTIDGETGALYSSAKAYYRAIGSRFPHLHGLLRDDLVGELFTGDGGLMIGVNQLAALIHCDPAQVTRSAQKKRAEIEAAEKVAAEAAASEAAVEAAAEAAAEGKSEAEAEAAAAAVLKHAEKAAKAAAEADEKAAAKAAAAAEEKAATKATRSAISGLETALAKAGDQRQNMSAEQRAQALKLARAAISEWAAFDRLLAEAEAKEEVRKLNAENAVAVVAPKPAPRRKAATN